MKKLFLGLIALTVFCAGCSDQELRKEECGYCGSGIYYHQTNLSFWGSEPYAYEAKIEDGVRYHPWCGQIVEDNKEAK